MYKADDTPMPVDAKEKGVRNNQIMQCHDWENLTAWTQHPDRNACYDNIDGYKEYTNTLELFAFCPADSPYYSTTTKYFDKFGHQPLSNE